LSFFSHLILNFNDLLLNAGRAEGHHKGDTNKGNMNNEIVQFISGTLTERIEEHKTFNQKKSSGEDRQEGNSKEDADSSQELSVADILTVLTDQSREGGGVDSLKQFGGDIVSDKRDLGGGVVIFTVLKVEFRGPVIRLLNVLDASNDKDDDK